jgi:murein L,D-transpeptidase YcbB/YkuD
MYRIIKPKKFQLYVTSKNNKMRASQVRAETGADIVINASLFDSDKWTALCDVKVDGKILSNDKHNYWGYGWNANDNRMHMVNDINMYANYVTCAALIKDGQNVKITADAAVRRAAGRTAIGFREDGMMVVFCTKEGENNMSLETLRSKFYDFGCVDALALDGGGSSQLSQEGSEYVYSSRYCHNYICIWIDKEETNAGNTETPNESNENPYREPARNLSNGCSGEDVKWLQYELNRKIKQAVDGIFGTNTKEAVKLFQRLNGLSVDGIAGPNTISLLK